MLKKNRYSGNNVGAFENYGSNMIRIIFNKCDPSAKSSVHSLKAKLYTWNLDLFDQNGIEMFGSIKMVHNENIHSSGKMTISC